MGEDLSINRSWSKEEQYQYALSACKALLAGEQNQTANLANVAAVLKEVFNFFWVGFYLAEEDGNLVLGPFQGPVACTRINLGKGVCGTSALERKTIVVPDVEQFPGHISCNSASRSEIVVPLIQDNRCFLVLDVDSEELDHFDEIDEKYLSDLIQLISTSL